MRKILILSGFIFLLFLGFSRSVFATPAQEVLGYSSTSNVFPVITAGTGFLLPDNPLYLLDKIFQNVKLAVAFDGKVKLRVQTQILGERMAELREMYVRKNMQGINTVLFEVEKEAYNLSENIKAIALDTDVSFAAKSANDVLKDYRNILALVSSSADDQLSLRLDSTNYSLLVSKVKIEDYLNTADQEDAIASDLETEVENAVLGASTKAAKVEKKIVNLEKRTTKQEQLEKQKQAQKEKIEAKKQQAKEIVEKRKALAEKRKKLLEERKKKLEAAKQALQKIKEAAARFKEAKKAQTQLKTETETED
ncbi:MAG: hypothetical protein HYT06_02180 [Candidatus Levybacteria bacterium]|nr:hypothetical protein [Candidatus Levybacteria bacterium]